MKRPKKIGVVYSANSKIPRRIVVPHPGDEWEIDQHEITDGESILHLPGDHPHALEEIKKSIAAYHGIDHKSIPSGRTVVVHRETNEILDAIMADPEIDEHEHVLIAHEHAYPSPLWKYHEGDFYVKTARASKKDGIVSEIYWQKHDGKNHVSRETDDDVLHVSNDHKVGDKLFHPRIGNYPSSRTRKI